MYASLGASFTQEPSSTRGAPICIICNQNRVSLYSASGIRTFVNSSSVINHCQRGPARHVKKFQWFNSMQMQPVQLSLGRVVIGLDLPSKIRWVERSTVTSYPASMRALQVVGVTVDGISNPRLDCMVDDHIQAERASAGLVSARSQILLEPIVSERSIGLRKIESSQKC